MHHQRMQTSSYCTQPGKAQGSPYNLILGFLYTKGTNNNIILYVIIRLVTTTKSTPSLLLPLASIHILFDSSHHAQSACATFRYHLQTINSQNRVLAHTVPSVPPLIESPPISTLKMCNDAPKLGLNR